MLTKRELLVQTTRFLQAVVNNDPDYIEKTADFRYTQNGEEVTIGETEIWKEVVRFEARQTFADPVTQSTIVFATATNETTLGPGKEPPKNKPGDPDNMTAAQFNRSITKWWFYAIRLTFTDEGLKEAEETIVPEKLKHFDTHPSEMPLYDPMFDTVVAEEDRVDRDELIRVADQYWEGLEKNIEWDELPVHPDCVRIELGVLCSNARRNYVTVQANFQGPRFTWKIENRRYYIADVAHGVVICVAAFKEIPGVSQSPGFVAFEGFKIECGLIKRIIATFMPMTPTSGWGD